MCLLSLAQTKVLQDLVRVRGCCHNLPKLFVLRTETSQMIIYDPRQMKGIRMEEFYSIPKISRLSSFLVTDKQDPIHFCVLDIFSHFICSLGRGRGRGIQFVV